MEEEQAKRKKLQVKRLNPLLKQKPQEEEIEVKEKLDQLMPRQLVTGAHLIALVRMIVGHKQLKKLFLGIFNCLCVLLVLQLVSKVLKVPLEVMEVMGGVRGLLRREKSRHFLDEFAFHNVFYVKILIKRYINK